MSSFKKEISEMFQVKGFEPRDHENAKERRVERARGEQRAFASVLAVVILFTLMNLNLI